ncbi:serine/threonine-protein kinase [Nocardiopsis sp. RSe5-2]|uniref:non-specific serine/threonine protein kinase n=1 Tax=Nocardiopsis endophytica TaxID=3018445 RepID=A0ABT4U153_9ACTN|nr:serine/threonine-protein kinase [Nocardiopsis endophytica]MDA2810661.1 serine/threonine-protein kinase [Nocardiopsis endophytica]
MSGDAHGPSPLLAERYELNPVPMARGGMGEVWEGHDTRLDREVAVKFIRFPDGERNDDLVRRFVRESRITARLCHPGVPAVYDAGTEDGRPYLVMQRIHGISVADLVAEQERLPVGWAAAIAAQVCAVLTAAHRRSLVHRDLKPANLMLEPDGTVKVLDFGLAVALDRSDGSRITRTGDSPGTPAYMAPEQVMSGMSTPQTDLYSLGCTLHEMLTGRRVFTGSTPFAVMHKQVHERPRPVRELRPDVPADLDAVIDLLLEKRPEDRPADAGEVYRRMLDFAAGLGPIPGVLDPPAVPSPTRMQASVLERVFSETLPDGGAGSGEGDPARTEGATGADGGVGGAQAPGGRPETAPETVSVSMTRPDIARARSEAAALAGSSRYRQAADVLEAAAATARAVFASDDTDVIALRTDLANVLFEGGDFRAAEPVFSALAADLARSQDPSDVSLVFRCRLQAATCRALAGETGPALTGLKALLVDEERTYGPDDPRPLELRRQIGLLQRGVGEHAAADATLRALAKDLLRIHGPDHPGLEQISDLLDPPLYGGDTTAP